MLILDIQTASDDLTRLHGLSGRTVSIIIGMGKETSSPMLLFGNVDLTPIHSILWTDLHTQGPERPVERARNAHEQLYYTSNKN